jgi:CRISPR-associated protein Cas2
LSDLIDPDYDSVYIYRLPEKRWVTKEILGQAKTVVDMLLE